MIRLFIIKATEVYKRWPWNARSEANTIELFGLPARCPLWSGSSEHSRINGSLPTRSIECRNGHETLTTVSTTAVSSLPAGSRHSRKTDLGITDGARRHHRQPLFLIYRLVSNVIHREGPRSTLSYGQHRASHILLPRLPSAERFPNFRTSIFVASLFSPDQLLDSKQRAQQLDGLLPKGGRCTSRNQATVFNLPALHLHFSMYHADLHP